jgi:hypothetical protein
MLVKSETKLAIQHIERRLGYLDYIEPSVNRIIDLVQNNPKFFGAKIGGSSIDAAAEYLERLVSETANNNNDSGV